MTSRGRHRLTASVLSVVAAAFLGTACGGGGGEQSNAHMRPPERPDAGAPRPASTATSAAAAAGTASRTAASTTSTSLPRPFAPASEHPGSDGVAAPHVIGRGRDLVAIVRSLGRYGIWLEWHDPDASLVEHAYVPDSDPGRQMKVEVDEMRRLHRHVVEVDSSPREYVFFSRLTNIVSFHVTEHLQRRDVVDVSGRVLSHAGPALERSVVMIWRPGPSDPWRLFLVAPANEQFEMQF